MTLGQSICFGEVDIAPRNVPAMLPSKGLVVRVQHPTGPAVEYDSAVLRIMTTLVVWGQLYPNSPYIVDI